MTRVAGTSAVAAVALTVLSSLFLWTRHSDAQDNVTTLPRAVQVLQARMEALESRAGTAPQKASRSESESRTVESLRCSESRAAGGTAESLDGTNVALESSGDEFTQRACKDAGICTAGHPLKTALSVPTAKYGGAACHSASECDSGKCRGKRCVPSHDFKTSGESGFCKTHSAHGASVGVLPSWVTKESPKSATVEKRLKFMDSCVERWRTKHYKSAVPCVRCHSISQDPILVNVHTRLISSLPAGGGTLCETGFNRGDSSLILATAFGENSNVLSFSMNSRWYTSPGHQCLGEILQDTSQSVTLIDGYTTSTIPNFLVRNPDVSCDVIHVDGCKDSPCRLADLENLRKVSHKSTFWVSDDIKLSCNADTCHSVYKQGEGHCLFDAFVTFMHSLKLSVKCIEDRPGSGYGVCYGYDSWDSLLDAKEV